LSTFPGPKKNRIGQLFCAISANTWHNGYDSWLRRFGRRIGKIKEDTMGKKKRDSVQEQIKEYIASQPEPKRSEMQALHQLTLQVSPACKLWFNNGKDSDGKTVANPTIGCGFYTIKYADGTTREFYQIGLSANKTGISVYILGIKDKTHLAKTYGEKLGRASVTGYCIKFKTLKDINLDPLEAAMKYGFEAQN
jgi:hypothetical protein